MLATETARTESAVETPWGYSVAIDAYYCDPERIRDRETIVRFAHELCDLLGVKRFGETQVVRFGDDPRVYGYSMVQLIETSLVSGHFAEDSDAVYLDVFSCKWYDADAAARFVQQFFRARRIRVNRCLRQ